MFTDRSVARRLVVAAFALALGRGGAVPFHNSRGLIGLTQTVDAMIVGTVAKN
jgi:hypothetical protein